MSSTNISLASSAVLAVTNRADGTLTLASGQTLTGGGIVNGILVSSAGSTVSPGTSSAVGTLTVSNNTTLNGNALFKLNGTNNDVLNVGAALTYGGTLTLINITATPLAAGNTFKLFNAGSYTGAFSSIVTQPPLAAGLSWNTDSLISNGTISVVSVTIVPTALHPYQYKRDNPEPLRDQRYGLWPVCVAGNHQPDAPLESMDASVDQLI